MNPEEKQRNYELAERLLAEQDFGAAIKVGLLMTLFGAFLYGFIPPLGGFSAAGIGIIVGLSMQHVGRGIETKFAITAALFTIAGCIIGSIFQAVLSVARFNAPTMRDIFPSDAVSTILNQLPYSFSLLGMFFWAIAVSCAVFLVKRPLARAERLAIGLHQLQR